MFIIGIYLSFCEFRTVSDARFVGFENYISAFTENGDFYHNTEDRVLYMYFDKGRPNKVYDDIEIGVKRAIFSLTAGVSNVVIDNICMKYAGTFAASDVELSIYWSPIYLPLREKEVSFKEFESFLNLEGKI